MRTAIFIFALFFSVGLSKFPLHGQSSSTPKEKNIEHTMEGWLGLYTKYKIKPNWYYYGEYHFRRRDSFQQMANLYLRFGITHIPNKNTEFTAGIVTPLYWAKDKDYEDPDVSKVVMQFRLWQQMVTVVRFDRMNLYHQIRTEQRWAKKNLHDAPFKLTFRFRYKASVYLPLNNHHLVPKTLFLSAYEEIFIQAGKSITYNHLEDNRMFIGLGYILNDRLQIQAGYMWSYRHNGSPYDYQSRHIPRISLYHNLDLYKSRQEKLKEKRQRNTILDYEF